MNPVPWLTRAMAGRWRPAIVGGTPIPVAAPEPPAPRVQCPACPESFTAPLELLAHLARCAKRAAA